MSVASLDLSGLPPGLVAYLAGGHDRVGRAFHRTLTSLADRGWLELTPEDSGASTVRIVRAPSRGELPTSEELVLERVHACSRSMPTVPLSELTNPDGDEYVKWTKRLKHALDEESRAMGLTHRTMHGALLFPFALLSAAFFGAIGALAEPTNHSGAASGLGFIGLIAGLIVAAFLVTYRPTESGKQVAAQARTQLNQPPLFRTTAASVLTDAGTRTPTINDQATWSAPAINNPAAWSAPAIADAVPGAPARPSAAETLIAKDGQPLPPGKAWSTYTGKWRVVTVGPTFEDGPVKGRPRALFSAAYVAAFFTAPAAAYGLLAVKHTGGAALAAAPTTLFVLYVLLNWLPNYSRRLSVTRRVTYRGQIVKRWTHDPDPSDEDVPMQYCCSVDNGTSDITQSFRLKQDLYKRLHVGDTVEVTFSPRWRKLNRIRRL